MELSMYKKQSLIVLCLISLSILGSGSGCVSKVKYMQLEASMHSTEKQAAKDLEDAQSMYKYQKKINMQLAGRIEKLELEMKKKQSDIKLQKEIKSLRSINATLSFRKIPISIGIKRRDTMMFKRGKFP